MADLHIQLGDVAVWVGSSATSLALYLTYMLLRATRQEQRNLRSEQHQAQARKVSAWCEKVEPTLTDGLDRVTVRLQNASDEPIYSVRAAVGADWWSKPIKHEELDVSYVVPPQYSGPHTKDMKVSRMADGDPEHSPPVEIIFSDVGGNFWHRDRYGRLSEITEKLPSSGSAHFFRSP